MEIKILVFVAAGIAGFFIAHYSGNKLKAISIPAVITGVITLLPVLTDPESFGLFGLVGLVSFVAMASISPAIGAAIGCGFGFVVRKLKQTNLAGDTNQASDATFHSYALKFKEIYLTPKNIHALIISAIGMSLIGIAYIVMLNTHENISNEFLKTAILLLNPIGIIIFLLGLNKLFKESK